MKVIDCGDISPEGKKKFVLTGDIVLYFGVVTYHKDLEPFFKGAKVIGAGTIPSPLVSFEDIEAWGGSKSTGYEVETPEALREEISETFKEYFEFSERI